MQNGDEHARLVIDRVLQRLPEHSQVAVAPYQRRLAPSRHGMNLPYAPAGDRLDLPLGVQGFDLLRLHGVAHEAPGRLPDQHRPGRGTRLQARSGVHRVADDRLAVAGHEHLSGGDADPRCERDRRSIVQRLHALLHVHAGAHGSERVILVGRRQTEDGHHRVPDVHLDPAAVALDRRAHLGEVALKDRAEHLGVVLLP